MKNGEFRKIFFLLLNKFKLWRRWNGKWHLTLCLPALPAFPSFINRKFEYFECELKVDAMEYLMNMKVLERNNVLCEKQLREDKNYSPMRLSSRWKKNQLIREKRKREKWVWKYFMYLCFCEIVILKFHGTFTTQNWIANWIKMSFSVFCGWELRIFKFSSSSDVVTRVNLISFFLFNTVMWIFHISTFFMRKKSS